MKGRFFRGLAVCVGAMGILVINACSEDCTVSNTCAGSTVGQDGGDVDASTNDARPDGGAPPAGCDPAADPKDAPKCVVSEFGIFVDAATGNDGNPGSKELPVRSLGAALTKLDGRPRVYVCEGTYVESVKLSSPVSIYGGFACGTWAYSGTPGKLAPSSGIPLTVDRVSASVIIADLGISAPDAIEAGASSIGVFAIESASLTLRRVMVTAGKGKSANDEGAPPTNLFSADAVDLEGTTATGTNGGGQKTCACKSHGSSVGGKGGNGGNPAESGGSGNATPTPMAMGGRNSAGGAGYPNGLAFACEGGKPGPDGSAREGGAGAGTSGALTATAWTATAGSGGAAGNPGAGGGGGGGGDANGSGGGGCGGCGGAGGKGGAGGGSSLAVVADRTALVLESSKLVSSDAGRGGNGGTGEAGGGGGGGAVGACGGGRGGNGAGGSGGGGGAGGLSVGILRRAGSVARDGSTPITTGTAGVGGGPGGSGAGGNNVLGTAPAGNAGTKGKDGVSQEILEMTQ